MGKLRKTTAFLALFLYLAIGPAEADEPLTIFAAASLTDAMTAAGAAFEEKTGTTVRFSFAASSTLARQIEAGAPAQIFASANEKWIAYLEARGLIAGGSVSRTVSNRLVLVAPASQTKETQPLESPSKLLSQLGPDERLAVGDPAHVPAGIYARQALESLGLWEALEPRLARSDNVRAALALVESGETPLGIAYATDAMISPGVVVLGYFAEITHDPIAYPIALVAGTESEKAEAFLDFLTGSEGLEIFESFGFERVK